MPTKHRRIAITLDPELEEALERARERRGAGKIDAALVREVLIASPEAMPETGDERFDRLNRWALSIGATPAVGKLEDWVRENPPVENTSGMTSDELIAEQRRERL